MKIFVVGSSRSGTTLMARVLGNSKEVFTFHELHFYESLYDGSQKNAITSHEQSEEMLAELISRQRDGYLVPKRNSKKYEIEAKNLLSELLDHGVNSVTGLFSGYLDYETRRNDKEIPCEQTPRYVFYIKEILQQIPDSKILNMIRDPRAVVFSQRGKWRVDRFSRGMGRPIKKLEKIRNIVNYHPVTIAKLWSSSVKACSAYENDKRVMTLKFEDLIANPEVTLRDVCKFLDIDFSPDMLHADIEGSSSKYRSGISVGYDNSRLNTWQGELSASEIAIVEYFAGKEMMRFGYAKSSEIKFNLMTILWGLYFPIHGLLVLVFNANRAKGLISAAFRRFGFMGMRT